jgi:hypothetical protein
MRAKEVEAAADGNLRANNVTIEETVVAANYIPLIAKK